MTITIAFLTHNRRGVVSRCFRSLLPTLLERDDVDWLILDNGSTDGTAEWLLKLAKRYPRVRVILSAVNLGVGGGRQRLFDEATGDVIVSLDSDVEAVRADWLEQLTAPLADPSVGVVGCAGHFVMPGWSHYVPGTAAGVVDVVAGYCQTFRRAIAADFTFDPVFYPYFHEDSDFCLWVRSQGYSILHTGNIGLRHVYSNSANASTEDGHRKQRYLASKWQGKHLVLHERQEQLARLRKNALVLE